MYIENKYYSYRAIVSRTYIILSKTFASSLLRSNTAYQSIFPLNLAKSDFFCKVSCL